MTKNIIIAIQSVAIIVLCWLLYSKTFKDKPINEQPIPNQKEIEANSPYKNANLTFELVESENATWGYKIILEGSAMIVQPNKPGLPGNEGFKTKEQAQKVAEFVISKIRKGQMPPTVTIEELRELGVL